MAGPRVAMLGQEEAVRRAAGCDVPEPLAELNVFRVLLNHPKLAGHVSGLLTGLLFGARLAVRLRVAPEFKLGWAAVRVLPATIALLLVLAWLAWQITPDPDSLFAASPTDDLPTWVLARAGEGS